MNNIGCLTTLQDICLDETVIRELTYSISHLTKLIDLWWINLKNLRSFSSSICGWKSLQYLVLVGCSNLEDFLEIMKDMEYLRDISLCGVDITELLSTIEHLRGLDCLELRDCDNLEALPNSIGNMTYLYSLILHNCSKLHKYPNSLISLQCCLTKLELDDCNFKGVIPTNL